MKKYPRRFDTLSADFTAEKVTLTACNNGQCSSLSFPAPRTPLSSFLWGLIPTLAIGLLAGAGRR